MRAAGAEEPLEEPLEDERVELLELELELDLLELPRLKPEPASAYGAAINATEMAARNNCFFMRRPELGVCLQYII